MSMFGVFLFLMILMVAGIGVDVMNYQMDRGRLQGTLDTAVLAAADLSQPLPAEDVVSDYLEKNGLGQYLTGTYVEEDPFEKSVTTSVSSTFDTQYMRLSGVDTMSIDLLAAALERTPSTEISVVLDISGSMGTNQRLERMQIAAKRFIT